MTYFTSPSELAFAFLLAGVAFAIASIAATLNTVTFRTGSPAAVADRTSHRVAGFVGAALITAGAVPLLFGPVHDLIALTAR